MSNLFQKLEFEAFRAGINPRTKEAQNWFRKKAQAMGRINRQELLQDDQVKLVNRQNPLIGSMNMFFYDPKHKDTLPYYDRFPLAIIVKPAPGGFYGLNLHYLPNVLRAKFLDALLDITNNDKYDETTKFDVTLKLLQSSSKMKFFKPCLKHYLTRHVRSRLARVQAPEWEIATFLPTAQFEKANKSTVYTDSRKAI
jgi:hypothetical protein|tara:strand:- start:2007 stop:2597 length:591 start_codon:yes stop_codon:yes gene_type:complete